MENTSKWCCKFVMVPRAWLSKILADRLRRRSTRHRAKHRPRKTTIHAGTTGGIKWLSCHLRRYRWLIKRIANQSYQSLTHKISNLFYAHRKSNLKKAVRWDLVILNTPAKGLELCFLFFNLCCRLFLCIVLTFQLVTWFYRKYTSETKWIKLHHDFSMSVLLSLWNQTVHIGYEPVTSKWS